MTNMCMPFIARHESETISLCCRKINDFWKIHCLQSGEWVRLNTQCPNDVVESSPSAEWRNGQWHITFIAGGAERDRLFRLYEYVDGEVTMVKSPAYVGFCNKKMLVYGGRERSFTIEMPAGNVKKIVESENLDELLRISYDPAMLSRLLISGRYNGVLFSWIYNMGNNRIYNIEADEIPACECAFFDGKCYYTRPVGESFEDREVVEAQKVKVTPLENNLLIAHTEN